MLCVLGKYTSSCYAFLCPNGNFTKQIYAIYRDFFFASLFWFINNANKTDDWILFLEDLFLFLTFVDLNRESKLIEREIICEFEGTFWDLFLKFMHQIWSEDF